MRLQIPRSHWAYRLLATGYWLLATSVVLPGCSVEHSSSGSGGEARASNVNAVTLRVPLPAEPTTLDPAKVPDLITGELMMQCFESLTRYNDKNEIEPSLAEKWEVSKDGKTYTFHLRSGVKFQNGREFVAADVKYSWERALAPELASPVAANYLDGVLGVKEIVAKQRRDLSGVEVVDAHTVKVTIDRPRAYFLGMVAFPTNFIVCKEAIEKNGGVLDAKAFVGTGPFILESYQPGKQATLKANPNYWGGKPRADRIEMPIILAPETLYNNFEAGQIDMWTLNIPNTRYAQDRDAGKFTSEYHLIPTAQIDYLTMHPGAQPAFAKKEVRLAFAMAIDRKEILKVAYRNVGEIAHGFAPPTLPNAGESPPPIPYDPAKAKQLLAQAGYPNGKDFPTLTLSIPEHLPVGMATAQIIRNNLRDNLGITVNVQEREVGQLIDDSMKQKVEFYLLAWIADYPDAQDFLSALFVSNTSLNHYGYSNPKFDALCAQADAEMDTAKRAPLYAQANRLLMEDVAVLPIAFAPRIVLAHSNVKDWRANLCNVLPHTQTTK